MLGEDRVPVVDKISMSALLPDHRPQLLQCPVRARVRGHVYVGQSTCPVFDDNKHLQHPKGRRHRDEEVTCEDCPGMIPQEGGPALITTRPTRWSFGHVLADCSR